MEPVNLGRKYSSMCHPPMGMKSDSSDSSVCFPSTYLEQMPEDMELPRRGRITFEYELNSSSENYKDEKTSVSMDLLQIVSVVAKAGDKKPETGEEALDKFVSGKEDDTEESDREDYAAE